MGYIELFLLVQSHLPCVGRGKVRDSFLINHEGKRYRLVLTSDRISIFDFVLGFDIPRKGEVLNAINIFNMLLLARAHSDLLQDIVAYGPAMDSYLPPALRGNKELWTRAVLVEDLNVINVEGIRRWHLTGTGYATYLKTLKANGGEFGTLCGHRLPAGLRNGQLLDRCLFTPTTKAEEDHDVDLPVTVVGRDHPGFQLFTAKVGETLREHAASVGLILADTKFEVSRRADFRYVLVDERGTPDSSRFWGVDEYAECWPERLPKSLDKEAVRIVGRELNIHKRDPKIPRDRREVSEIEFPADTISDTTRNYLALGEWYMTTPIETFKRDGMGIE